MKLNKMVVYFMLFGKINAPGFMHTRVLREFSFTKDMPGEEKIITSVAQACQMFQGLVNHNELKGRILFRGERKYGIRPPIPGIFRAHYNEFNILRDFKSQCALHEIKYKNDFEWLSAMQHNTVPTRLLDWSQLPLVSLYMAVDKIDNNNQDCTLYALDAHMLNRISSFLDAKNAMSSNLYVCDDLAVKLRTQFACNDTIEDFTKKVNNLSHSKKFLDNNCEQIRMPIAVYPKRTAARMKTQASMFTLHGGWKHGELAKNFMPIELEELNMLQEDGKKFLRKYKISNTLALKQELAYHGFHSASVRLYGS